MRILFDLPTKFQNCVATFPPLETSTLVPAMTHEGHDPLAGGIAMSEQTGYLINSAATAPSGCKTILSRIIDLNLLQL